MRLVYFLPQPTSCRPCWVTWNDYLYQPLPPGRIQFILVHRHSFSPFSSHLKTFVSPPSDIVFVPVSFLPTCLIHYDLLSFDKLTFFAIRGTHGEGNALLPVTMTTAPTPPSEYPQHDERSSYSNLEVANHIEGQPYHYVPYSEAVKDMDKSSAMAAEYYLNPPLFAQNPTVEEKILSPGDSVAPEVSPHPYGHAPEVAAQGYPYHHHGHAQQEHGDFPHQRQDKPGAPVICGIRRKTFWIVLGVVAAVVLAAAVGGGVGGYFANRSKDDTPRPGNDSANTTDTNTAVTYRMSIAALKWEDPKSHYRVYLQPAYKNDTQILESAWDSDTQRWSLTSITKLYTDIKPNAPLAAVAGIPHSDPVNERMASHVNPRRDIAGCPVTNTAVILERKRLLPAPKQHHDRAHIAVFTEDW